MRNFCEFSFPTRSKREMIKWAHKERKNDKRTDFNETQKCNEKGLWTWIRGEIYTIEFLY